MKKFLELLLGGGVTFESPWKLSDGALCAVIPVTLKGGVSRGYLMYEEVKDRIKIKDSGSIGTLNVEGAVEKPIFFRGGTAFLGIGTQSRVASYGRVLIPNRPEQTIEAKCIHASHGIRTGASFQAGGYAPHNVEKTLLHGGESQGRIWGSATEYACSSFASSALSLDSISISAKDDLIKTQKAVESTEKFKKEVEEKLAKIPDYTTQIGLIIVNIRGIVGLEVFDSPESWTALARGIIKKYTQELMEKSEEALYMLDNTRIMSAITGFLEGLKVREDTRLFENEVSETFSFKNSKAVGEYTRLNGEVIHLVATKREEEQRSPRIAQPIFQGIPLSRDNLRWGHEQPTTIEYVYSSSTSMPIRFLEKKNGFNFLDTLSKKPKTWTELKDNLNLSDGGLSQRIHQAKDLNLIEQVPRLNDGKKVYRLTAKGHYIKQEAESQYE